ncbi:MAG: prephenate dehydrogenase [Sulfuricurvum sp. PC08-66]|nr:MAG: prephenate dehydrogenase [Sulfuricurvum sp. PC08-66]
MQKSVGIIGLGLMGGSMGLALKKVPFISHIVGLDGNPHNEKEALSLGLVDAIVDFATLQQCDIIFLAIPVDAIIATMQNFDAVAPHTLILDLGSTKAKIISQTPAKLRTHFVAAHPMTGTERFGPSAALEGLYTHKVVVLCDLEASGEPQRTLALKLFEALEMKIVRMSAVEHDSHVAYISHLPHVLSYALANTVLAHEDRLSILNLAAGGFKDMSRLAKSSPNMWEDIFRQNQSNLLATLQQFQKELDVFVEDIQKGSWESLNARMQHANTLHEIL